MGVGYDEIGEILKLIDGSSCDEFVLETRDIKLVVRRHADGSRLPAESAPAAPVSKAPFTPAAAVQPVQSAAASGHDPKHVVRAPMVGTFYRSQAPGEPPFVDIGKKVNKGDAIGLIEVMKLFTTIHAEWSGTVTEIGAENAQFVEYGQMLFVITPD
jgi:acetyl-CoA carboxylase biotin carboxyl carrier protein